MKFSASLFDKKLVVLVEVAFPRCTDAGCESITRSTHTSSMGPYSEQLVQDTAPEHDLVRASTKRKLMAAKKGSEQPFHWSG